MRQQLDNLPKQQAMFLLTLLVLEGKEALELLRFLPEEESYELASIGEALGQESRKQILPQLVKEIKRLIGDSKKNSPLTQIEAAWLADFISQESPRILNVVLRHLPRRVGEEVVKNLPRAVQRNLPSNQGSVPAELWKIVQKHVEDKLPVLPTEKPEQLSIETIYHLSTSEMTLLIKELGIQILAIAFRGAGRGPLTELCRRLSQTETERLLNVIRNLPTSESSEVKSAQKLIRSISSGLRSKSQIIEEAGYSKFGIAISNLSTEAKERIAYRLPQVVGKRLLCQENPSLTWEESNQSQIEVLELIRTLAEENILSQSWLELELILPEQPPSSSNSQDEASTDAETEESSEQDDDNFAS